MFQKKSLLWCTSALVMGGTTGVAHAQTETTTLVETAIPDNFDRDRNTNVALKPRPDYDPLGIRVGSFTVQPRLETYIGATDNVYDISGPTQRGDGYVGFSPQIAASSDWDRHALNIYAGSTLQRFFHETARNQTTFDLKSLGRLDMGGFLSVTGEAQFSRQFETIDTGAIVSNLSILSSYQRSFFSLRGAYNAGRSRFVIAFDRTAFSFNPIESPGVAAVSQADRDRVIYRGTAQGQYAFTPSASVYVQGSLSDTSYSIQVPGGNRDSTSGRFIGGLNMDLAGLLRGKIGVGYSFRNYNSAIFPNVSGFSAEAKLEYFFSPLTTFTLTGGRTIEDASIGTTSAYYDSRVALRADHELLRNLLLNGSVEYARQDYIGSTLKADTVRVIGGATYLSNRWLRFNATVFYQNRVDNGTGIGSKFGEWNGRVGVTFTR